MSELTPCNFCDLQRIERDAKRRGWTVSRSADPLGSWTGGIAVYVHPVGTEYTQEHRIAWFAELPDRCCC